MPLPINPRPFACLVRVDSRSHSLTISSAVKKFIAQNERYLSDTLLGRRFGSQFKRCINRMSNVGSEESRSQGACSFLPCSLSGSCPRPLLSPSCICATPGDVRCCGIGLQLEYVAGLLAVFKKGYPSDEGVV